MAVLKRLPVYPLLFGIFPALTFLAQNITEVRISAVYRIFCLSLALALLLYLLLRAFLHNWHTAAAVCAFWLLLFFSYGHVHNALYAAGGTAAALGRHRLLLLVWLGLALVGAWLILRRKDISGISPALNVIASFAVLLPVLQIVYFEARLAYAQHQTAQAAAQVEIPVSLNRKNLPDIYYIILDAYSRADILEQHFKLDNQPFLKELAGMGFYVAPCSQSNYSQTQLSLISALNFDYYNGQTLFFTDQRSDTAELMSMLKNNRVRQIVKGYGYKFVAFETGFSWSEFQDADIFLSRNSEHPVDWREIPPISEFETLFLQNTAAEASTGWLTALFPNTVPPETEARDLKRGKILYDLEKLKTIPVSISGPKLVFAHIAAPHSPFVFDSRGEPINPQKFLPEAEYIQYYRDELSFLNREVLKTIHEILRTSPRRPVIILQSDHGNEIAKPPERMDILNAYYLPDGGEQLLYPTISPVNTFRLVFNYYLHTHFDFLEDISYFSSYTDKLNFTVIPNSSGSCGN